MKYKVFKVDNGLAKENVLEEHLNKVAEDGYEILWITSIAGIHFIVCKAKE